MIRFGSSMGATKWNEPMGIIQCARRYRLWMKETDGGWWINILSIGMAWFSLDLYFANGLRDFSLFIYFIFIWKLLSRLSYCSTPLVSSSASFLPELNTKNRFSVGQGQCDCEGCAGREDWGREVELCNDHRQHQNAWRKLMANASDVITRNRITGSRAERCKTFWTLCFTTWAGWCWRRCWCIRIIINLHLKCDLNGIYFNTGRNTRAIYYSTSIDGGHARMTLKFVLEESKVVHRHLHSS